MIDILSGVLAVTGPGFRNNMRFSHQLQAIKIEAFTDVSSFKSDIDDYMTALVETPPAPGHDRVVYTGLPEHETEVDRRAKGIPLHSEVIAWFDDMCSALAVNHRLEKV
jgi:LDH2 family malate/lactate/ureidoglycolate dehydrogenase